MLFQSREIYSVEASRRRSGDVIAWKTSQYTTRVDCCGRAASCRLNEVDASVVFSGGDIIAMKWLVRCSVARWVVPPYRYSNASAVETLFRCRSSVRLIRQAVSSISSFQVTAEAAAGDIRAQRLGALCSGCSCVGAADMHYMCRCWGSSSPLIPSHHPSVLSICLPEPQRRTPCSRGSRCKG